MALNNLEKILATHPDEQVRNGAEAVRLAQRAMQATVGRRPEVLSTLAAAHAKVGQLDQAIKQVNSAIEIATSSNQQQLVVLLKKQLQEYESGGAN